MPIGAVQREQALHGDGISTETIMPTVDHAALRTKSRAQEQEDTAEREAHYTPPWLPTVVDVA